MEIIYSIDNDNIIYNENYELLCNHCNKDLYNNIVTVKDDDKTIKCKNCNNELENYNLISCIECNYNFLLIHNYINNQQCSIAEYFKIYEKVSIKIFNKNKKSNTDINKSLTCTHMNINTFFSMLKKLNVNN